MSKNRALRRKTNYIKNKKRITRWWHIWEKKWEKSPAVVKYILNNHGKCNGLHTRKEIGNANEAVPYQERKVREKLRDDLNTANDVRDELKDAYESTYCDRS